jgi:hypothetical protein
MKSTHILHFPFFFFTVQCWPARLGTGLLFMVKFCQPSHEFTFGVGITFIPYPLVLTPSL